MGADFSDQTGKALNQQNQSAAGALAAPA